VIKQNKMQFISQSGDWQAPLEFVPTSGVLVARLGKGQYAIFKYGMWRRVSASDWQVQYASMIPAGLPTGWWGMLPKLYYKGGSYVDNFNVDTINSALDKAAGQLNDQVIRTLQAL
jgi:hypothetical protein